METELRLPFCARPACEARRNQSRTGSCCDGIWVSFFGQRPATDKYLDNCLIAIAQISDMHTQHPNDPRDEAQATFRTGIQHSLAQWQAALERAECLCSEMLNIGLPSCCAIPAPKLPSGSDKTLARPNKCCPTASLENKKKIAPEATTVDQRPCPSTTTSLKACCPSLHSLKKGCSASPGVIRTRAATSAPTPKVGCSSGPSNIPFQSPNGQHGISSEYSPMSGGHQSQMPAAIDLEKASAVKHAVTQITGMTCTGCERKLQRVLSTIPEIHNVHTSLVLGRAEFDVDARSSIDEIALLLERQTEFKCIVHQEGHQLDVLIPRHPSGRKTTLGARADFEKDLAALQGALAGPNYPSGVQDVKVMDAKGREWKSGLSNDGFQHRFGFRTFSTKPQKYTARITYDPRVVGARDLLEKGFGPPLSLAPLSSDVATATDTDHLRETFYMTLLSAFLTIPVLVLSWAPLPPHPVAYGASSLALATLVQIIVAGPFYHKALKALVFSRMIEMDLLVVISTTTAYIYSVVAFVFEIRGKPLST